MRGKYFNNPKPQKLNRRDTDRLIWTTHQLDVLIFLMAVRDEFGFGKKRAKRLMEREQFIHDAHMSGHLSVADMQRTVKDELDIFVEIL